MRPLFHHLVLILLLPTTLLAQDPRPAASGDQPLTLTITHDWESSARPGEELDSMALWEAPDGKKRLYVAAKASDLVYVLDGATGADIGRMGGTGTLHGMFRYPNGVAVHDDLLYILERDNHRLQVFSLPEEIPLISIGEAELKQPYGIAITEKDGNPQVFVTDNYNIPPDRAEALPLLGSRVRHFEIERSEGKIGIRLVNTFGATDKDGALWEVESIVADSEQELLFICDETKNDIKVYTFAGEHVRTIGAEVFQDDPEGIAIIHAPEAPMGGFLIASDQGKTETRLRIFSRDGSRFMGTVLADPVLANTDGICLVQGTIGNFRGGVLYAIHDDATVRAYDLGRFLRAGTLTTE